MICLNLPSDYELRLDRIARHEKDIEVYNNPFEDRRSAIFDWKRYAVTNIAENEQILELAEFFSTLKIHNVDSLHLACAVYSDCDFFITTDDDIVRHFSYEGRIKVLNPADFIKFFENMEKL